MNTLRHIEAMQATATALEEMAREARYSHYSQDAKPRAKQGFAVLVDEDGEISISPLDETWLQAGPTPKKSKEEQEAEERKGGAWTPLDPYEPISSGHNFEKVVAQSHARSKETGQSNPMQVARDAARLSPMHVPSDPVARAKQAQKTADAKAAYQAEAARNQKIFAQMKEQAAKMYAK